MTDAIVIDLETTSANPHVASPLLYGVFNGKVSISSDPPELAEFSLIGHNIKYDLVVYCRANPTSPIPRVAGDTMLMLYLLYPNESVSLKKATKKHLGYEMKELVEVYNDATGKQRAHLPDKWYEEVPEKTLSHYLKGDLESTFRLHKYLDRKLTGHLRDWYEKVELPFLEVLTRTELRGVKIDRERLLYLDGYFARREEKLTKKLHMLSGTDDINLNSSKQLQEVLYKKLRLGKTGVRKTKTGLSTNKATLKALSERHAFPALLLELREVSKLRSTYCTPILEKLDAGGRLHCTFNQCLTRTRRLSSENPNLQNIPAKTKDGKKIKQCFIAEDGHFLLIADYSQVELRILAHFSQDPVLLDAFMRGQDLHARTAKEMGVDRQTGKTLNFSIIYGKTAFGFSKDWDCHIDEAQKKLDDYFKAFPRVRGYIDAQKADVVRKKGWVFSLAGLPLYCGDPHTNVRKDYESVMRSAVNYRIQSSSQDILKRAVVSIYNEYGHAPVLTVHDSLVYELPDNQKNLVEPMIYLMEHAWDLSVPLKVDYKIDQKWRG